MIFIEAVVVRAFVCKYVNVSGADDRIRTGTPLSKH